MIQGRRLPIQGDCLVQQPIVGSSLNADNHMVPRTAHGIARNARGYPLLIDIVIDIPLVAASDSALVTPNKRMATRELIDVELQRL